MNVISTVKQKFNKIYNKLLSYIPSALPVGLEDFDSWAKSIIDQSKVPDNDSVRFSLAVMVLHLETTISHKAKAYFVRALHKAAANQVVSQVIQDLKAKQAQPAAAPATPVVAAPANDPQQ